MSVEDILIKNLKYQMTKQNISVEEMVNSIGVSIEMVEKYLSNKTVPRFAELIAICLTLGVSPNYMLGFEDEEGNKLNYPPNRQ